MVSTTFRIVSGGRAGTRFVPVGDDFIAGRHADAALRFDPDHDLAVSARHARFLRTGSGWAVQDLDSRNGTFVNGRRITQPTQLRAGDRVTFGAGGPELDIVEGAAIPDQLTRRIRMAVRAERRRAAIVGTTLVVVIVVLASALAVASARSRSTAAERSALEQRIDSLIAEGRRSEASLAFEVAGLTESLRESERRLQQLRTALQTSSANDGTDTEALRRELLTATTALRRQQLAASLDFALIQRRARGAVVMVWVEYGNGERMTGTAFAVQPDGVLLTARHLVRGPTGQLRPARIAVRFADSDQAFPARVVAVSHEWDLAALRVDNVLGDVPVVPGFNLRADTLAPGSPVALIGYPLGGEADRDSTMVRVARPVVSAALLLDMTHEIVNVQGLGAEGASGSPILDANGEVIALLFGGGTAAGEQTLLGVPAAAAAAFLTTVR